MGEAPTACRGRGIDRLLCVVSRLRGENGCPWDREQTLDSLKPCLIEESYEVLDALDSGDPRRHQDELGDVLLQVALHARIREEEGAFTFDDVANGLADKLIRRHPHVFGDARAATSQDVLRNWEKIKASEKKQSPASAVEGVPRRLPALQKAQRVQGRAARVGFDWTRIEDVLAKVEEELAEVRKAVADADGEQAADEIGDLLFAVVNLSRFRGVDAEQSLEKAIVKFTRRFEEVARRLQREGREITACSLAEMDAHWEAVKREERAARPAAGGRAERGRGG
jgi:tetrapyrrole methylase family protein/MazG family protein